MTTTSGLDLEELLERVEKATGPDRLLDARLRDKFYQPYGHKNPTEPIRAYTASVDAALALVERVLPKSDVSLFKRIDGWNSFVKNLLTHEVFAPETKRPNGALAILSALFRALIAQEKQDG